MNMITRIDPVEPNEAESGPFDRKPRPLWQKGAFVALPVLLVAGGVGFFNRESPAIAAPPPPTVTVAQPLVREVSEWDDYVGRFEPSRRSRCVRASRARSTASTSPTARSSRRGNCSSRSIRARSPRRCRGRAGLASAQSDLALAQSDLGRAERLVAVEAVSKSDVERLQARVRSGRAAVAAAEARVRAVRSTSSSPRSARRSRAASRTARSMPAIWSPRAKGGRLAADHDQRARSDLLHLRRFGGAVPQDQARAGRRGTQSPVEIRCRTRPIIVEGQIDFTDNGLDPKSGTIRGRAVLPIRTCSSPRACSATCGSRRAAPRRR
jgi:multidrug efflux system membrane fusion protein